MGQGCLFSLGSSFFSDCVTIKVPYDVDVLLHWPTLHREINASGGCVNFVNEINAGVNVTG